MSFVPQLTIITLLMYAAALCFAASAQTAEECTIAPARLRCEYLVDPLGIDVKRPRLSWIVEHARPGLRGRVQTAYRILVSDDPALLARDEGNLWDTGKISSDETIQIEYAGRTLRSCRRAWWKVRTWDNDDRPSAWSDTALWSMGLLDPSDWSAQWIGDPTPVPPVLRAHNGYHSEFASSPDVEKWIVIALDQPQLIHAVRLFPARPYDWREDVPGLMFPLRFRIDLADTDTFERFTTIIDQTAGDVPNPGVDALTYSFAPTGARYVRLLVTKLRMRDAGHYATALAEMQVLSDDTNVALGATVTAGDSIETGSWAKINLVDGDLTSHPASGYEPLPAPMLRKDFRIDERGAGVAHATVHVTALGLYELHINGERIGDHVLAPEWTDYNARIQYQTYDVTDLIRRGENAIGARLGDGWYAGSIGLTWIDPNSPPRAVYGRRPALLLQLNIEFDDGNARTIISDGTWRSTMEGSIRAGDLLDGETCDARRAVPGWDTPGFDDSAWQPARLADPVHAALVAQRNQPIRITHTLRPITLAEPSPGAYVFDMGQNMVGWCRIAMSGPAGTAITLRHAEMLDQDGTIYTANLRGAAQTDQYILRGEGREIFEPRFTYHGFRYVQVTGLLHKPSLDDLAGCVIRSAPPEVGQFACSSALLNRLMQNIVWTQRANMHSTPTDCPQRDERLGWMGDILAFAQAACFNMDMSAFFSKWLPDVRDAQAEDGRFPDFAPHPFDPNARFSGAPGWADAGVIVPWRAYCNYGDVRIIEQHYNAARRWVEYVHDRNPDLLWRNARGNDYGDWLNADTLKLAGWPSSGAQVPKDVFATAFFAHSTAILSKMAAVIGRRDDAQKYASLAASIRDAFNTAYVRPDGSMSGDTQAGYALALHFDLLPDDLRAAAAQRMVDRFAAYHGHISTGFHSTCPLMLELSRNGYNDDAYRLINKRTMPSWGYAIDHGATTIWERWDGYVEGRGFQDPGMNSFSHYALGSVGEWMYRTIIGINPDPKAIAFERIIIRPRPGGGLTWARGSHDSIRGRIPCRWERSGDHLIMEIDIPANTTALVHVPTSDPASVMESGRPAGEAPGVAFQFAEDGAAVYRIGSGRYVFEARFAGISSQSRGD